MQKEVSTHYIFESTKGQGPTLKEETIRIKGCLLFCFEPGRGEFYDVTTISQLAGRTEGEAIVGFFSSQLFLL